MTPAINEKNFETESYPIFCLTAIGLQYTLLDWIFQNIHCEV
jgi:hypothetical protein